jgi:hypothetical protein
MTKLTTNPCKVSASPKDLKDWMIGTEPDYYETEVISGQTCHFEVRFYPNTSFPVKTRIWEFQPHYPGLSDEQSKRFRYKIGWDWNQPQTKKIKSEQFEKIKDKFARWIVQNKLNDLFQHSYQGINIKLNLYKWSRNQLDNMILGDVLERISSAKDEALLIEIMRSVGIDDEVIKVFTFNNFPSSSYGSLHPTQFFTYN